MTHIQTAVRTYMTSPVRTIDASAPVIDAWSVLREHSISSLAVLEEGKFAGVISRTDLLREGHASVARVRRAPVLSLPDKRVAELMRREPVTVAPEATVADAARKMVEKHIHRVFVTEGESLVGVISTTDVMGAVRDKRVARPVSDFMSTPVLTVKTTDAISKAVDQLEGARVAGLVVLDEEDGVAGVFTQLEALQYKDVPSNTRVEDAMSFAVLCLDLKMPIHRAAAHAAALRVRRVVIVERQQVWGMLTGIDFARAAL